MNSENSIRKICTNITDSNLCVGITILYLLPYISPIIITAIDKIADIAHDAIEHGYDLNFKAGLVDIALTKNNL